MDTHALIEPLVTTQSLSVSKSTSQDSQRQDSQETDTDVSNNNNSSTISVDDMKQFYQDMFSDLLGRDTVDDLFAQVWVSSSTSERCPASATSESSVISVAHDGKAVDMDMMLAMLNKGVRLALRVINNSGDEEDEDCMNGNDVDDDSDEDKDNVNAVERRRERQRQFEQCDEATILAVVAAAEAAEAQEERQRWKHTHNLGHNHGRGDSRSVQQVTKELVCSIFRDTLISSDAVVRMLVSCDYDIDETIDKLSRDLKKRNKQQWNAVQQLDRERFLQSRKVSSTISFAAVASNSTNVPHWTQDGCRGETLPAGPTCARWWG